VKTGGSKKKKQILQGQIGKYNERKSPEGGTNEKDVTMTLNSHVEGNCGGRTQGKGSKPVGETVKNAVVNQVLSIRHVNGQGGE